MDTHELERWRGSFEKFHERFAEIFCRPETREQSGKYLQGLVSGVERKNGWLSAASQNGDWGYTPWTFWPKKSDQFIIEQMDSVFTGKTTPVEFSKKLQEIYAAEARENKLPPALTR